MRRWLGALALCGGCAQILGTEDPVPANPISPSITSEYLLGIQLHTSASANDGVIELRVPVEVDPDTRRIDIHPIALSADAGHGDLDALGDFFGDVENDVDLDFTIEWQLDLPAEAAPGGQPLSFEGDLNGRFPSNDGFCGTLDGTVTAPTDAQILETTTFAAFKVEPGTPPAPKLSCDEL